MQVGACSTGHTLHCTPALLAREHAVIAHTIIIVVLLRAGRHAVKLRIFQPHQQVPISTGLAVARTPHTSQTLGLAQLAVAGCLAAVFASRAVLQAGVCESVQVGRVLDAVGAVGGVHTL